MINAAFFDLGNTVVDYHKGIISDMEKDHLGLLRIQDLFRAKNIVINYDKLYSKFYLPWTNNFPARKNSKTELDVLDYLSAAIPLRLINRIGFVEIMKAFHEPSVRFVVEMPGARKTIQDLRRRQIPMGIISNTPIPGACHDMALKRLGLLKYFRYRVYSYDAGIRKPDGGIFERAADFAKIELGQCIMIGDSFEHDIRPAKQAGMATYLVKNSMAVERIMELIDDGV